MSYRVLAIIFLSIGTLMAASGCGGSLSPLYADFRIEKAPVSVAPDSSLEVAVTDTLSHSSDATIQERIAEALVEAGWELDEPPSDNAVSTSEVEIAEWGLYDVRVSLDVVPINQKFVRVYVHAYRQYFYGSRSKMSYLNRRVRRYVLPDLAEAFQSRGIIPVSAPPTDPDPNESESENTQDAISASRDLN